MQYTSKRDASRQADLLADEWQRPVAVIRERLLGGKVVFQLRTEWEPAFDIVVHVARPSDPTIAVALTHAVNTLVAEMTCAGIPNPLSQPVTLAAVVADLFRIATPAFPPPATVTATLS